MDRQEYVAPQIEKREKFEKVTGVVITDVSDAREV